ncbi:hypothetical protein HU200_041703 [Digitaria exilis]|uniref:Uncharacterized protein n=1 Tax=Digitaria exilis TaxID=1010633 RepID=A0A835EJ01_9POAL|nr:hypothetical protein HU200_041703 [Digitaria exilis]
MGWKSSLSTGGAKMAIARDGSGSSEVRVEQKPIVNDTRDTWLHPPSARPAGEMSRTHTRGCNIALTPVPNPLPLRAPTRNTLQHPRAPYRPWALDLTPESPKKTLMLLGLLVKPTQIWGLGSTARLAMRVCDGFKGEKPTQNPPSRLRGSKLGSPHQIPSPPPPLNFSAHYAGNGGGIGEAKDEDGIHARTRSRSPDTACTRVSAINGVEETKHGLRFACNLSTKVSHSGASLTKE